MAKNLQKKQKSHFAIVYVVVIGLLVILVGKLLFVDRAHVFLYGYGLLVTFVLTVTFAVVHKSYKDPYLVAKESGQKKSRTTVSILVAAFNEEGMIARCLDSLMRQSHTNKEVIVVNDCSTDKTGEILDEYVKAHAGITVIHMEKNSGKKRALAAGMLEAKGEYFAFTDSDSVLASDAIEKIALTMDHDKTIGGVSGHCRALNGEKNLLTKTQDSWYEGQFSIRKAFESVYGAVTCVSGPLAVFRKDAIYNYIPAWQHDRFLGQEFKFATDRTLTGFVLGSETIGAKLKEKYAGSPFLKEDFPTKSWRIVYSKAARAWTAVPDNLRSFMKQQIRWKKSFIRNMFFTGAFFWRKNAVVATNYYLHILFVLAGPFIAIRHLIWLPIVGNVMSAFLYLAGILTIGFAFGLAYKLEDRHCRKWKYRPLMSIISTVFLSPVIFYSMATIRKMVWSRG